MKPLIPQVFIARSQVCFERCGWFAGSALVGFSKQYRDHQTGQSAAIVIMGVRRLGRTQMGVPSPSGNALIEKAYKDFSAKIARCRCRRLTERPIHEKPFYATVKRCIKNLTLAVKDGYRR